MHPIAELPVHPQELDLDATLECGQAFRWRRGDDAWWTTCIAPRGAVRLRQVGGTVQVSAVDADAAAAWARDYLRLDVDLTALAHDWRDGGGPEIIEALDRYPGLRVLRQDPVEGLFS